MTRFHWFVLLGIYACFVALSAIVGLLLLFMWFALPYLVYLRTTMTMFQ
jgi:hypothetical protein